MSYRAPVKDMLFGMKELAGLEALAALPGHEDAGIDTAAAVLDGLSNVASVLHAAHREFRPDRLPKVISLTFAAAHNKPVAGAV